MSGRYGPYVKWGKVNATLPDGQGARRRSRSKKRSRSSRREPARRRRRSPPSAKRRAARKRKKPRRSARPPKAPEAWHGRSKAERPAGLPSRSDDSSTSSRHRQGQDVGKREIARAFGIKGATASRSSACSSASTEDGKLTRDGPHDLPAAASLPASRSSRSPRIDSDGELDRRTRRMGRGARRPAAARPASRLAHRQGHARSSAPPPAVGDRVLAQHRTVTAIRAFPITAASSAS